MRAATTRYRPTEELGHGASATVWRAHDTRTGHDVILKRFHRHLLTEPEARRRIFEEAAAAARVSHPNIVSAVDMIDDDGLALVFPYVEGRTLADRLSGGRPLGPGEAATVVLDIADALAVAHQGGVVHRDVKPANILLGNDGRARLFDFGISRAVDQADRGHELTGAGLAIGTLPYMAPEQLAAEQVTPASDIYGLGVVLYELLAGRRPYAASTPVALSREQSDPPAPIAGAPRVLAELAMAALAGDASRRPDANQLARGLRAWLDHRVEAEAPTAVVAATRRTLPRRAVVALGLAVIVLAAAYPLAAGWISGAGADHGSASAILAIGPPAPSPSPSTAEPPTASPLVVPAHDVYRVDPPGGGATRDRGPKGQDHKKHRKH